jgi:hypothetical protein
MGKDIEPKAAKRNLISLDPSSHEIDISELSIESQEELKKYAAIKSIDLQASVLETQRDLQATSIAVENMAAVTRQMSDSGDAVTVRQSINNNAGKVEILMGNTNEAKHGNVDKDKITWLYVLGGILVLVIVAFILGN